MKQRRFLMLTKSKKLRGKCIAGLDMDTGEWIRLNLLNNNGEGIKESQFKYNNYPTNPRIMHAMLIEDLGIEYDLFFQPENVFFNPLKIRKIENNKNEIETLLEVRLERDSKFDKIFYNNDRAVTPNELENIIDYHSLMYVKISDVRIVREDYTNEYGTKISYKMSFTYKNDRYERLSITDTEFKQALIGNGPWNYESLKVIISLGELFEEKGLHYKLVAAVFNDEE